MSKKPERPAKAEALSKLPCKFFLKGKCHKGDRCPFSHKVLFDNSPNQPQPKRPSGPADGGLASELVRKAALKDLRSEFLARCRRVRPQKGGLLSALDKWHFALLRRADMMTGSQWGDPVLPLARGVPPSCERYLSSLLALEEGFDEEVAAEVSAHTCRCALRASKLLEHELAGIRARQAAPAPQDGDDSPPDAKRKKHVHFGGALSSLDPSDEPSSAAASSAAPPP